MKKNGENGGAGTAFKKSIISLILAVAVLCIAGITGCVRGLQGSAGTEERPMTRVSVIFPHSDDGYWSLITEGIEEAYEELGEEYGIDIKFYIPQLNYNIPQMTDILRQQVAARVDFIIIQGNEDEEFRQVLYEAHDAGIQVICVDTPMEDFPYDLYIGTDNFEAGRLLGQELSELTDGKGDLAVVSGSPGYKNLDDRLKGLREAISAYPDMHIKKIAYDEYDGLTFMQLYHSLDESANVLVCIEGTGGQTLSHTYSEKDTKYDFVVGFDSFEGAEAGVLDGIVKQDTNGLGRRAVEEIARYVSEGEYSSRIIYTEAFWLDQYNYDEVMR